MPTLDTLATRFARCVSLFRDPSAKSDQKKEFRALLGLLQETAVTLRLAHGGSGIELNGVPCEGEGLAVLVQRLDLHGIGEIALPANPPPAQLFELLQALADQPGAHDVASRLAAAGADHIRLAPAGPPASPSPTAPPGLVESSEDFGAREPVVPNPDTPVDRRSGKHGTEGILRGEAWRDIKSVPLQGVPMVTHDAPPPPAADALPGVADRASRPGKTGADELLSLSSERHPAPASPGAVPPPPPPSAPPPSPSPEPGPPAAAEHHPARAARGALPRAAAVAALQRGGAAGVEVLMDVLAAAPTVGERRAVFDALKHMTEGTDQLVHMLDHSAWFVVRNVAELIGELGMEDAVPALGKCLDHADERVRKAVGLALAKIGTRGAAEPAARGRRRGPAARGNPGGPGHTRGAVRRR